MTRCTTRFRDGVARADADPAVRAIILTGTPEHFCAGTDLSELREVAPGTRAQDRPGHTEAVTGSYGRLSSRSSPRSTAPPPASASNSPPRRICGSLVHGPAFPGSSSSVV
nr:enoyl-CoA hydratase-related protein [Nocardia higoensis]